MRILPDKWSSRGWRLISLLMLAVGGTSAQAASLLGIHLLLGQPNLLVTGDVSSAHTILFTSQLGNSNSWQVLTNIELPGTVLWVVDSSATNAPKRFYRAVANPTNMAFIPAGPFVMGDAMNDYPGSNELPLHTVQVSALWMDKYEVTKALWDEVYNWAITNGYSFEFGA